MKSVRFFLICFVFSFGSIFFVSAIVDSRQTGILFLGVEESGVSISTFLCNSDMDNSISCSIDEINNAINFDMSGGSDLVFFNNFLYWLKQKSDREHFYKVNYPYLNDNDIQEKVDGEGYGAVGVFSITLSSNPTLVKFVDPEASNSEGTVTLVAQLWYNGDDVIQLWSQDIVHMQQGTGFKISVTNKVDDQLEKFLRKAKSRKKDYAYDMGNLLQPDNRNKKSYNLCSKAPRSIRFIAG